MEELARLKLLVTITDRPKGETAARICAGLGVQFHLGILGKGTASSEVLDVAPAAPGEGDPVHPAPVGDQPEGGGLPVPASGRSGRRRDSHGGK